MKKYKCYSTDNAATSQQSRVTGGFITAITFAIVEGIAVAAIVILIFYKKYWHGKGKAL